MQSRIAVGWLVAAVAFPPAGLVARAIAGPADSILPALAAGAIAGAMIGLGYALASGARRPMAIGSWIVATAAGLGLGLAAIAATIGVPVSTADVLATGLVTGITVGIAQAFLVPAGPGRLGWALAVALAWTAGWFVTASIGVDLTQGWAVFGASGAVTAQVILVAAMLAGARRTTTATTATTVVA